MITVITVRYMARCQLTVQYRDRALALRRQWRTRLMPRLHLTHVARNKLLDRDTCIRLHVLSGVNAT